MKMLLNNHFENAVESLKSNKVRTYLSIFGIMVGIASITIILSLLTGTSRLFGDQSAKISDTTALIRSGSEARPDSLLSLSSGHAAQMVNTLTEQDAREIAKATNNSAAPLATFHANLSTPDGKTKLERITIIGSSGELAKLAGLKLREGQFIDEANGVVIGKQLSIDLFGTEKSLGSVLKLRGETLTVVGVLDEPETAPSYLGVDFNRSIILPLAVSKKFTQNTAQIQQILITADNGTALQTKIDAAKKVLAQQHQGDTDYHTLVGQAITAPNSHLVNALSTAMAVIAGISLLVGGIGITNIMLVSVAERQREVGIRKAVGATNRTIVAQFLIESAIIGLFGGVLGYVIGLGASFLLGMYLPFTPVLEWQAAALTIGGALIIGMLFGIYPASRAAGKDPIESLRH